MDLHTLYSLVTEAIRKAEVLDELDAPGARDAHLDVSMLEERIADLLPPSDEEGAIARRGAVAAAIDARELERAEHLAARFSAELAPGDALKDSLTDLRSQAALAATVRPQVSLADETTQSAPLFVIFRDRQKNGGRRIQARAFSSIDEVRRAVLADKDLEAVRIEVYLHGDSADELRHALDRIFPLGPQPNVA